MGHAGKEERVVSCPSPEPGKDARHVRSKRRLVLRVGEPHLPLGVDGNPKAIAVADLVGARDPRYARHGGTGDGRGVAGGREVLQEARLSERVQDPAALVPPLVFGGHVEERVAGRGSGGGGERAGLDGEESVESVERGPQRSSSAAKQASQLCVERVRATVCHGTCVVEGDALFRRSCRLNRGSISEGASDLSDEGV